MKKTVSGMEVEGIYSGRPTEFVHDKLYKRSKRVYFNPEYINKYGYSDIVLCLKELSVAICVTPEMLPDVPQIVKEQAHVVVALPVNIDFRKHLKGTDEIRMDYQEYENTSFVLGMGIHASRIMYQYDKIVENDNE